MDQIMWRSHVSPACVRTHYPFSHPGDGYELSDLSTKAELLYTCMVTYGKNVPNFELNTLNTVADVVRYFEQPPLPYGYVPLLNTATTHTYALTHTIPAGI